MNCPLFITAPDVDSKLVNRLLLHLRDWEYGEAPTWDNFRLIPSKTLIPGKSEKRGTAPPIQDSPDGDRFFENNEWRSSTVSEVESFLIHQAKELDKIKALNVYDLTLTMFAILDEQSVIDKTIILGERDREYKNRTTSILDRFKKTRVQWKDAYIMFCNLNIGNMDFDGFVQGEKERDQDDMWYTYQDVSPHPDTRVQQRYEEDEVKVAKTRQNEIKKLEDAGMA